MSKFIKTHKIIILLVTLLTVLLAGAILSQAQNETNVIKKRITLDQTVDLIDPVISGSKQPKSITIQEELDIYHKNTKLAVPSVGYYDAIKVLYKILKERNTPVSFDQLVIGSNSRHGLTNFKGICDSLSNNKLYSAPVKISISELQDLAQKYGVMSVVGGNRLYAQILSVEKNGVRVYIPGFANPKYLMPMHIFKQDWDGKVILINNKSIPIDKSKLISEKDLLLGDGCENTDGLLEEECEKKNPNQMVVRSGKLIENAVDFKLQNKNIPLELGRTYRQNIETEVDGWSVDKVYGSSWAVVNGKYMGNGHITVTRDQWTNPSITVDMKTLLPGQSLVEVGEITFCYTDVKNRYAFFIAQGGYLFIGKYVNSLYPTVYLVDGWTSSLNPLEWNNIEVRYNNGNIKVYANRQLVIDITDPNPLPQGKVGLESHLSRSLFDNVTIRDTGKTLQNTFDTDDNNFIFGYGWHHSFGMHVKEFYNEYAMVYRPDGRKDKFKNNGNGTFTKSFRNNDRLTKNAQGYILAKENGTEYHFDLTGKLIEIVDTNNNKTTLSYDNQKLSRITDSTNRAVNFQYGINGMVEKIIDPAGNEYTYLYEGNFLITVEDPEGNVKNYTYDNTTLNVTSIESGGGCCGDGGSYAFTADYFYNDQVWKQIDTEGNTKYVDYLGHTTVITNNKGESHSYDFAVPQGAVPLIQSETDRRGRMTTYRWDDRGNLLEKIDRNNNHFVYTYDSMNNTTSYRDPEGNLTQYTYTPLYNKMSTITDSRNNITKYEHNNNGNLIKITMPDSISGNPVEYRMTYTQDGLLDIITDPRGNTKNYDYDQWGNISKIIDSQNNITQFTSNVMGKVLSVTDARGNTTQFQYDKKGNLIKKTSPAPFSYETYYQYDGSGNIIRTIFPNGKKLEYEYNSARKVISIKDYTDDTNYNETTFTYDATNYMEHGSIVMTSMTDPNGNITNYNYDEIDRLIKITDAEGNETRFEYDHENNITKITDAAGNQTRYAYSGENRLIRIDYQDNTFEQFNYDNTGNVVSKTDRNGNMIGYTYDSQNRLTTITYPDNTTIQFVYDKAGNITQMTDKIGTTNYIYDNLNRLQSVTYPGNKTVSYEYDAAGNITHIHYPGGNDVAYQYDQLNRNTDIIKSGQLTAHFIYDNLNKRVQRNFGNSAQTTYSYDNLNRLIGIVNKDRNLAVLSSINYNHDNVGNITEKETQDGSFFYQYDKIYRLTNVTLPDGRTISYGYDDVGNRLTKNQNAASTAYSCNNVNQLLNSTNSGSVAGNKVDVAGFVKDNHVNAVTVNNIPAQIEGNTFHADNISLQQGQNTVTVAATDTAGNTTTKQNTINVTNETNISYQYDKNGNMIQKNVDGKMTNYIYDYENKLVRVTETGLRQDIWVDELNPPKATWVANTGTNCSLSSVGRIQVISNTPQTWGYVCSEAININVDNTATLEIKVDSVDSGANYSLVVKDITLGSPQPEYKFANQVTTPGTYIANLKNAFGYNGNRKYLIYIWTGGGAGKGVHADYVRIYNNQGGLSVDYTYDGLGRRVQKAINGVITKFIYDRENVIEEYDGSSQLQRTNTFSLNVDEILQTTAGVNNYYYNQDHLGSVTEITDNSGVIIEKYEYDPFGKPTILSPNSELRTTSSIGNRYMFTAREWDGETGLYYYRARYYDAGAGRFVSADPILSLYQYKGKFYNYIPLLMNIPQGLNPYLYVENNPLNRIDPGGLATQTPGCDGVPDDLEKKYTYTKACCDAHDKCYEDNNCSMQSWKVKFKEIDPNANKDCNPDKSEKCARCNVAVVNCFRRGGK